ncbi:MAG TPA: polymer-forming cytoskeletal protein [Dehalococcoidia bacterium]
MFFKKKRFDEGQGYTRINRGLDGEPEDFDDEEFVFEDDEEGAVTPVDNLDSLDLLGRNTQPLPPLNQPAEPEEPEEAAQQLPAAQAPAPAFQQRPAPPAPEPRAARPPAPVPPAVAATPAVTPETVTLVSKGARWEGKLSSEGDIRVEGALNGEIETDGTVFLAEQAKVRGTINARNVLIAGEVEGEIFCKERLEVLPGGSARGQINTNLVVIHEGAFVDSRFKMVRSETGTRPELQGSPAR